MRYVAMDHKLVARSMGGHQQVEKLAATFSKPSQVRHPLLPSLSLSRKRGELILEAGHGSFENWRVWTIAGFAARAAQSLASAAVYGCRHHCAPACWLVSSWHTMGLACSSEERDCESPGVMAALLNGSTTAFGGTACRSRRGGARTRRTRRTSALPRGSSCCRGTMTRTCLMTRTTAGKRRPARREMQEGLSCWAPRQGLPTLAMTMTDDCRVRRSCEVHRCPLLPARQQG